MTEAEVVRMPGLMVGVVAVVGVAVRVVVVLLLLLLPRLAVVLAVRLAHRVERAQAEAGRRTVRCCGGGGADSVGGRVVVGEGGELGWGGSVCVRAHGRVCVCLCLCALLWILCGQQLRCS